MEHQHKSYELDAKIRFLECLKRLQELRELNYDHSQTLTQMQVHCEDKTKATVVQMPKNITMKEEPTWTAPVSLDDEMKLRDYYKPKLEAVQANNSPVLPVTSGLDAFNVIRQQHLLRTQRFTEKTELINRLVMQQPLTHISAPMTSNAAYGLIRYYDQLPTASPTAANTSSYPDSPTGSPLSTSPVVRSSVLVTGQSINSESGYVEIIE